MRTPMQSCVEPTCPPKSSLAVVDALLTAVSESPISSCTMVYEGRSGWDVQCQGR